MISSEKDHHTATMLGSGIVNCTSDFVTLLLCDFVTHPVKSQKNQVDVGFDYFCTSYEKMGYLQLYHFIFIPMFRI